MAIIVRQKREAVGKTRADSFGDQMLTSDTSQETTTLEQSGPSTRPDNESHVVHVHTRTHAHTLLSFLLGGDRERSS